MNWYRGYIEAAGNIPIGGKREDGEYKHVDNQEVYINVEAGIAIKIEIHKNVALDKMIKTTQMYALGGTDNDFYLFEDSKPCTIEDILKGE